MKNKLLKTAILATLALPAFFSQAAIITGHYTIEGDKKVLIDTDTGIEWLKLDNTKGMSISDVLNNEEFSGWRFPTREEIKQVITTVTGYDITNNNYTRDALSTAQMKSDASDFVNAFGLLSIGTYYQAQILGSYGLTWDEESNRVSKSGAEYQSRSASGRQYWGKIEDNYSNHSLTYSNANIGVFLVSDGGLTYSSLLDPTLNANNDNAPINQVPLTGSLLLLAGGLLFSRRKN